MRKTSQCVAIGALAALAGAAQGQSFFEGFNPPVAETTTGLPAGWTSTNNSPGGPGTNPNWNWRNEAIPAVFPAFEGGGYVYANYNSSTGANDISNYLISPLVTFNNGDTISFYSRTVDSPFFPDRMALEISTNGGVNPADFTVTLLTINPGLTTTGYPNAWTLFTGTVTGLGGPTAGHFAFHYNPTNGGPAGANSDYIGVDAVQYTSAPAPASLALLGLSGLIAGRRRR